MGKPVDHIGAVAQLLVKHACYASLAGRSAGVYPMPPTFAHVPVIVVVVSCDSSLFICQRPLTNATAAHSAGGAMNWTFFDLDLKDVAEPITIELIVQEGKTFEFPISPEAVPKVPK